MAETNKKNLKKKDSDPPAIGNFVHWHIQENKLRKKKVSDFLGISAASLTQYFKQPSLQFIILWRISHALQHNFLMELGERLGIAYETKKEKELKVQLKEKDALINKMEIQLEVYREITKKE